MLPKLKDDILRLSGDLTDINTVINLFANASNYLNKYTVLGEWNNIWLEFYSKSFNNKLAPDLTDFINEQAIKIAAETTSAAQLDPLDMIRTKFWLADFQASVFIKLKEYIERDINLKLSFIHSSSAEFIASIKGKDNDISKAYWNLAKEDYPEGSDGFALLEAYFLYRDSALRLGEEFHEKIDKLDDCWHEDDTLNLFNNALIIYNDNDLLQGTLRFDLDNKDLSEQFINLNIRIGIDYLDKFNSYVELLCSTSSISAKFFCPLVKALYFDSAYLNAHTTYKLLENIDSPEYPELKEYKDKAPQEANYQLKEFLQQEGDYLTEAHAATNYLNDELKTKWAEAILPHLHAEQKFSLVYLLKSLGQDYEDTCDDLKKFIDDYQYDDSSLSWDNRFAEACTYTPST